MQKILGPILMIIGLAVVVNACRGVSYVYKEMTYDYTVDNFVKELQRDDKMDIERLNKFFDKGFDANSKDGIGVPVIFYADDKEELALLLEHGANPNVKRTLYYDNHINGESYKVPYETTPLILFSAGGHSVTNEMAEMLLKHGANPNMQVKNNNPAIFETLKGNNYDLAELLFKYGADPNIKNDDGITLLEWAIRDEGGMSVPKVILTYLKYGADPSVLKKDDKLWNNFKKVKEWEKISSELEKKQEEDTEQQKRNTLEQISKFQQ